MTEYERGRADGRREALEEAAKWISEGWAAVGQHNAKSVAAAMLYELRDNPAAAAKEE